MSDQNKEKKIIQRTEKNSYVNMDKIAYKSIAAGIETKINNWRSQHKERGKVRWVFELIQNAVDSSIKNSNNDGLKIKIQKESESKIKFEHNGGHFTNEQLLSLICGGSSKIDADELTGKFGSGFLVSHILGRELEINTKLANNNYISLKMERGNDDNKRNENILKIRDNLLKIKENIQEKKFEESIKEGKKGKNECYTTCFKYISESDLSNKAYREAKKVLKNILPSIFAFNSRSDNKVLNEINICDEDSAENFKLGENVRVEELNKEENVKKIEVEYESKYKCFYYIEEDDHTVGFFSEKKENRKENENVIKKDENTMTESIIPLKNKDDYPRFFVKGQPIINDSVVFKIPFLINSDEFDPDQERTKISEENKKILEKGIESYEKLIRVVIEQKNTNIEIKDLYNLFKYNLKREGNYETIFIHNVSMELTKKIRNIAEDEDIKVVKNHDGVHNHIGGIHFIGKDCNKGKLNESEYNRFHNLCTNFANRPIPDGDIKEDWKRVIDKLKNKKQRLKQEADELKEEKNEEKETKIEIQDISFEGIQTYNLVDLRNELKEKRTFEDIKENYLEENISGKTFLNEFFAFCNEIYTNDEKIGYSFIEKNILPVQNGKIKSPKKDLKREEEEIDENLIEIAKELGHDLKSKLIHREFKDYKIIKKIFDEPFGELDAIDEIIQECEKPEDEEFGLENIDPSKNSYPFTLQEGYKEYLEKRSLKKLKEVFEEHGCEVDDDMKISKDNKGEWLVSHQEGRDYEIKLDEGELKVYEKSRIGGWIKLFIWCVANDRLENGGIPWITKESKIEEIENTEIEDFDNDSKFIPLKYIIGKNKLQKIRKYLDKENWSKNFEIYDGEFLLNEIYFETVKDLNIIYENDEKEDKRANIKKFKQDLKENGPFVIDFPVERTTIEISSNKLQKISEEEIRKETHHIKLSDDTENKIETLPRWENIPGRFRDRENGITNASKFFMFVYSYLVENVDWGKKVNVNCECEDGSHRILPLEWLSKIQNDKWVPISTIDEQNKNEEIKLKNASKNNIEKLFTYNTKRIEISKSLFENKDEFNEMLKNLLEDSKQARRFLQKFGFDSLDIAIKLQDEAKKEEEVREDLSEIVENYDIKDVQKAIKNYERKSYFDPEVNKKIGETVEKIIRNIIGDEDMSVKNKHKGSDMEVSPIEISGDDTELIEVKFTSKNNIRLSPKQVDTAREEKENYSLLVLDGNKKLKNNIKENNLEDEKLKEKVKQKSHLVSKIGKYLGEEPKDGITINFDGAEVEKKIWKNEKNIIDWLSSNYD